MNLVIFKQNHQSIVLTNGKSKNIQTIWKLNSNGVHRITLITTSWLRCEMLNLKSKFNYSFKLSCSFKANILSRIKEAINLEIKKAPKTFSNKEKHLG